VDEGAEGESELPQPLADSSRTPQRNQERRDIFEL
jgi:hypothetical protein